MSDDLNAAHVAGLLAEALPPPADQPQVYQLEIPSSPPTPESASARASRLTQLNAELAQVLLPTAQRQALEAERDGLLRARYEAEVSAEAAPVAPSSIRFAEGTAESTKNAFCALAAELGVTDPREPQDVADRMKGARWLPAAEFHAEMKKEWGDSYRDNLARVRRELGDLHGPLRDAIDDQMADDTRFSPEVARELVALPARRARTRR